MRAADRQKPGSHEDAGLSQLYQQVTEIQAPDRDGKVTQGYWFWGAADNFRLASVNATQIAERLLAS